MRNLKKSLAFVMAFALVFATVASAASFTDVPTSYSYSEEVELLADLGILVGIDGSTYQPDATLTRVQAAAVIFRCLTGRTSADMYAGATKFWDVNASYWGTGYINFCANAGAIGGYPDGSFKPDQPVTVAEFESMLVRALGLTEGKNLAYPNGYLAIADANLINDEVSSIGAGSPANRGLVAKLAYNAICNATYQTIATSDKPSPKIIEEIFKITPTDAIIVGADDYSLADSGNALTIKAPGATGASAIPDAPGDDKITYAYKDSTNGTAFATAESAKNSKDFLGQKVKVYRKTTDSKIYAVVPSTDNNIVTLLNAQIYGTSTTNRYYYKDSSGSKIYFTVGSAESYLDYDNASASTTFPVVGAASADASGKRILRTLTLVSNDGSDTSIEYVFAKTYKVAEFDGIYSDKMYFTTLDHTNNDSVSAITLKDGNTVKNVTYPANLAKGDGVMVYADLDYWEVTPLTKVSGELTGISNADTYTIGGTAYKAGFKTDGTTAYPDANGTSASNIYGAADIGSSYDILVTPVFGYMITTSEVTASVPNYFYVVGSKKTNDYGTYTYWVSGYKTDGTKVSYQLDTPKITLTAANVASFSGSVGPIYTTFVSGVALPANDGTNYVDATTGAAIATGTATTNAALKDISILDVPATMPKAVYKITTNSSNKITKVEEELKFDATAGQSLGSADFSYNANSKLFNVKNQTTKQVKSSSVFFFDKNMDGDTVKVYVGTFPGVSSANTVNANNIAVDSTKTPPQIKVAMLTGEPKGTTSALNNLTGTINSNYSLVSAGGDNFYVQFNILTQGEQKTIKSTALDKDDAQALADRVTTCKNAGTVVEYSLTADGFLSVADPIADSLLTKRDLAGVTLASGSPPTLLANTVYDIANVTGSNLLDNGNFVAGGYVVSKDNSYITIANGNLSTTGTVPANPTTYARQNASKTYTVSSDVKVYELDKTDFTKSIVTSFGGILVTNGSDSSSAYKAVILVFNDDEANKAEVSEIYYFK